VPLLLMPLPLLQASALALLFALSTVTAAAAAAEVLRPPPPLLLLLLLAAAPQAATHYQASPTSDLHTSAE
jgi:hypothetical protein